MHVDPTDFYDAWEVVALDRVPEDVHDALKALPGVNGWTYGTYRCPVHAAWLVAQVLTKAGVAYTAGAAAGVTTVPCWADVIAALRRGGEVRETLQIDAQRSVNLLDEFVLPYQREDIAWSVRKPGSSLWWCGGAGKTIALVLWALCGRGPVVIVTKGAARGQWAQQVQRFTHVEPYVILPEPIRKKRKLPTFDSYIADCYATGKRVFVIVAWTSLTDWVGKLTALKPTSVGFDESQMGKSQRRKQAELQSNGTKRYTLRDNMTAAAYLLSRSAKRRCCTTATPVKNRLKDLYAQLDLAEPGAWGSYTAFTKRYADGKPGAYTGWKADGTSRLDELNDRLSFIVKRRPRHEIAKFLPELRRQSMYLDPDDWSPGWTHQDIAAALKECASRGPSAHSEVNLAATASWKVGACIEEVAQAMENGQKVVVFDNRTDNVDKLLRAWNTYAGKHYRNKDETLVPQAWGVHGKNTTPESREDARRAYMEHPGPCVLFATGDSCGTAYDLQDTDLMLITMLPLTGGDLHQWEVRVARQGQKRPVLIKYLICKGTIDEHYVAVLTGKLPAMAQVVDDVVTADAYRPLAGIDDRDAIAARILAKLEDIDADLLPDD